MAKCQWCHQEMLTADDCTGNLMVDFPDGSSLPSVVYYNEYFEDDPDHRCHDCNVKVGMRHHPNCDMERCPKCGGQLISCGHLDEEAEG